MARPKLGTGETQRLHVMISPEELTAIDDWRFAHRVESRSEAVRRLVKMALVFDAGRHEFSDRMVAKGEAGSKVFEMAMAHIWQGIQSDEASERNTKLLAAVETYQAAENAFFSTLQSMFDEINFLKFANDPFVDAERRSVEKAQVLAELTKVLGTSPPEEDQ